VLGRDQLDPLCTDRVAFDSASNTLYVLDATVSGDAGSGRVMVFKNPTTNGQAATQIWTPPAASPFLWPRGSRSSQPAARFG